MSTTTIEWADDSHNPIRARLRDPAHAGLTKGGYGSGVGHYCEKVSAGCANCYSSTTQPRFGMPEFPGRQKGEPPVDVFLDEKRLLEPLSWKRPRKVFLCDMTDLFGPWVPFEWIDRIFAVMALTPHLTWQILTKRPERMAEYLNIHIRKKVRGYWHGEVGYLTDVLAGDGDGNGTRPECESWFAPLWLQMRRHYYPACVPAKSLGDSSLACPWPLPNVWLGTSVEDQQRADERIPHLLRCPAAVRFLSCEPLLSEIDLRLGKVIPTMEYGRSLILEQPIDRRSDIGKGIAWAIIGGESGSGARPMNVAWARSIVKQCAAADVACFVKQLGARPYTIANGSGRRYTREEILAGGDAADEAAEELGRLLDSTEFLNLRDSKGGDPSEWPEDLRVREFPGPRPLAAVGAGGEGNRE